MEHLQRVLGISQRLACRIVGQYRPQSPPESVPVGGAGIPVALLGGYLRALAAVAGTGRRLARRELDACGDRGMEAATAGVPLRAVVDAYLTATWRAGCCASHRKRSTNGLLAQSDSQGLDAYVRSHTSGCSAAWTIAPRRTREQLVSTVTDWPVGYVVVHGDRLAEPARAAVLAFLDGQTDVLCRLPGQGPLYVYRARWHPSGCQVR